MMVSNAAPPNLAVNTDARVQAESRVVEQMCSRAVLSAWTSDRIGISHDVAVGKMPLRAGADFRSR
jgi:hypothetical protein